MLFHSYQLLYGLKFLALLLVDDIHRLIDHNTFYAWVYYLYTSNNLDLFFWSPSVSYVLFLLFYCFAACDKLETNNNYFICYILYYIRFGSFMFCMYVVVLCDNKTREACEILYIHIQRLIFYLCIQFSLACFGFMSFLSQPMTNKQTLRIFFECKTIRK